MLPLPSGDVEGLELLGSGGFGLVYRGWSRKLGMTVALKAAKHGSNINDLMEELKKESKIMLMASHPHVLHLLGVYEKKEGNLIKPCLVMEYMPHGSLCSLLSGHPEAPWALRFRILHQVVLGMKYLHCLEPPIIHRDLKPGNVLLNAYLDVQITDFGLSKILGSSSSAGHPGYVGTLEYMPPEAITDHNYSPTKAFDVYSFGILMWCVFTGESPYKNAPRGLIAINVPKNQRPDETALCKWDSVKMMSEAKQLMKSCWDGDATCRPTFDKCSLVTSRLVKEYEDEMEKEVPNFLKYLRRPPPPTQSECVTSYRASDFLLKYNGLRTPTLSVDNEKPGVLVPYDEKAGVLVPYDEKAGVRGPYDEKAGVRGPSDEKPGVRGPSDESAACAESDESTVDDASDEESGVNVSSDDTATLNEGATCAAGAVTDFMRASVKVAHSMHRFHSNMTSDQGDLDLESIDHAVEDFAVGIKEVLVEYIQTPFMDGLWKKSK